MASKIDLGKFTSQNDFNMWKIKMKALLITQCLRDAIDKRSCPKKKKKTIVGFWAKLEHLYMKKNSLPNKLYIKKKMFLLKMIEGSSLDEYVDEFNRVCDELYITNEGLTDESKALLLINFLPKCYQYFVDALLYERQTLSLEEVKYAFGAKKLKAE